MEAKRRLPVFILESVPVGRMLGMVLLGGVVIHCDLLNLVGSSRLGQICTCLPVSDRNGAEQPHLRFVTELRCRGKWRGAKILRGHYWKILRGHY